MASRELSTLLTILKGMKRQSAFIDQIEFDRTLVKFQKLFALQDHIEKEIARGEKSASRVMSENSEKMNAIVSDITRSVSSSDDLIKKYGLTDREAKDLWMEIERVRKSVKGLGDDLDSVDRKAERWAKRWKEIATNLPFILGKQVLDQNKAFEEWRNMQHKSALEVNADITRLTAAGAAVGQSYDEVAQSVNALRKSGITDITNDLVENTGKLSIAMNVDAATAAGYLAKKMQMLGMSSSEAMKTMDGLVDAQTKFGLSSQEAMGIFEDLGPLMMTVYQKGSRANMQFEGKVAEVVGTMKKLGINSKYAVDSLKKALMPAEDDMSGLAIQAGLTGRSIEELMTMAQEQPEKYAEVQAELADQIVRQAGNNPFAMRKMAQAYGVELEYVMKANQQSVKAAGGLAKTMRDTRIATEKEKKEDMTVNKAWTKSLDDFGKGWEALKKQFMSAWLTAIRPVVGNILGALGVVMRVVGQLFGFVLKSGTAQKILAVIGGGIALAGTLFVLIKTIAGIKGAFAQFSAAVTSLRGGGLGPKGPGLVGKAYGLASGGVSGGAGAANVAATAGMIGGGAAAVHGTVKIHSLKGEIAKIKADASLSDKQKEERIKELEEEIKGARREQIYGAAIAAGSAIVRYRGVIGRGLEKVPAKGKLGVAIHGLGRWMAKSAGTATEPANVLSDILKKGTPVVIVGVKGQALEAMSGMFGGGSSATSGLAGAASAVSGKGGKWGKYLKIGAGIATVAGTLYAAKQSMEGEEGEGEPTEQLSEEYGVSPEMIEKAKKTEKPSAADAKKMTGILSTLGVSATAPWIAENFGKFMKKDGFPKMFDEVKGKFSDQTKDLKDKVKAEAEAAVAPNAKETAEKISSSMSQMAATNPEMYAAREAQITRMAGGNKMVERQLRKAMEASPAVPSVAGGGVAASGVSSPSMDSAREAAINKVTGGNKFVEKQLREAMGVPAPGASPAGVTPTPEATVPSSSPKAAPAVETVPYKAGGEPSVSEGKTYSTSGVGWLTSKPDVNIGQVHPQLIARVNAAAQEIGKKITLNEGFRTKERQRGLYNRWAEGRAKGLSDKQMGIYMPVNPDDPKKGWGSWGHSASPSLSVDMSSAVANELESKGLFTKFGLKRPYPKDPPHVEMIEGHRLGDSFKNLVADSSAAAPAGTPVAKGPGAGDGGFILDSLSKGVPAQSSDSSKAKQFLTSPLPSARDAAAIANIRPDVASVLMGQMARGMGKGIVGDNPKMDSSIVALISVARAQLNVQEQIYDLLARKLGGPALKRDIKTLGHEKSSANLSGGAMYRASARMAG